MTTSSVPAWPFLLGALVLFVGGLAMLPVGGGVIVGWILLIAAVVLLLLGVQRGRKALAAAQTETVPAAAPTPVSAAAKSGVEEYYASEAAVRQSLAKPKRTCPECRSPVLDKAHECPTCGSAL